MDLSHLSVPGTGIALPVTPGASRARIVAGPGALRVCVTSVPEGGKAHATVPTLPARAPGVPKSRPEIVRGQAARDKVIRVLG